MSKCMNSHVFNSNSIWKILVEKSVSLLGRKKIIEKGTNVRDDVGEQFVKGILWIFIPT